AVLPSVLEAALRLALFGMIAPSAVLIGSAGGALSSLILALLYWPFAIAVSGTLCFCLYLKATGRQISLGGAFGATLSVVPVLILVNLAVLLVASLGFLLLVVPGLYAFAMYSCSVQGVVIERRGWGALARAAALSQGYRWSILGLLVLVTLILGLAGSLIGVMVTAFPQDGVGAPLTIFMMVLSALASGAQLLVYTSLSTVLYMRLRDIKEGTGREDVARVFE
ncbi:MAG: hypothetical protein AAF281_09735, partial [Pseudomonadota bacterium]